MDYIDHQIDAMFRKLRKSIKQHANTYATKYKWCDDLQIAQAQEQYIRIILNKIPEIWIEKLNKIYEQIDKKFDRKYLFNIPQEARKLFISSWNEIDDIPPFGILNGKQAEP